MAVTIRSGLMFRAGGGPFLQDEILAAVGALDVALAFHVEEDSRVAQRPGAAVAGNGRAFDLFGFGRLHGWPLFCLAVTLTPVRADDTQCGLVINPPN